MGEGLDSDKQYKTPIFGSMGVNFTAGLITGAFTAGGFNPWDRALYLSVKNHSSFLSELGKGNPYQGFTQAVVQRTFSGMVYFAAAAQVRNFVENGEWFSSKSQENFFIGSVAGAFNGFVLNQLSVVKYYTWGKDNRSFIPAAKHIMINGGYKALFKGVNATITRDIIFGVVYEVSRNSLRKLGGEEGGSETKSLISNLTAAAAATVVSGPFNFARNIKYSTSVSKVPPSTFHCLYHLLFRASLKSENPLSYLQQRMRIGWGTGRVAVGMASGQWVFDKVKKYLESL